MGKDLFKKVLFLCICIFFGALLSKDASASEEIYFDEEGNLNYITYDKKATSATSYKAIGWILKRYDAPINASGQQYVIVRKIEYVVEDEDNPGYLYCHFWSDKDEILDAVEAVSSEWRKQLETYGDMVYIDSVMTVCKSGVPLGNVDKSGTCTGEVYYTLEGIQNARPWANKQYLTAYYDLQLRFPILTKVPSLTYDSPKTENKSYISSSMSALRVDSDEYDVSAAIPAGENIDFIGSCDRYQYKVNYDVSTCVVYVPVEVKIDYIIKWVDFEGKSQSENRTISKWYKVPKTVGFTSIKSVDVYDLQDVSVKSSVLDATTLYTNSDTWTSYSLVRYGEVEKRFNSQSYSCYAGKVTVSSKDFKKPAIPETNYYEAAKNATSNFKVRSDCLSIDGKTLLSNSYATLNGYEFTPSSCDRHTFSKDDVKTLDTSSNGWHKDFVLTCKYKVKNGTKTKTVTNKNINAIRIHTPIVAKVFARGDKTLNQADTPENMDIVLGAEFYVYVDNFGMHNNIKGYGVRDYSKYVGSKYIRFPFKVWYEGELYEELQWISIGNGVATFTLPEDVSVGRYEVECLSVAKNGMISSPYGVGNNRNIAEYGAYTTNFVNVIGRIYDFKVENTITYVAGDKDKDGAPVTLDENVQFMPVSYSVAEDKVYKISVSTLGDVLENDKVFANINYYYVDDGEVVLVDLYEENANKLIKCVEEIELSGEKADLNQYQWTSNYAIPHNFIAVNKGSELNDLKNKIIRGKTIFISFDFVFENTASKNLLYVNGENFLNGYCNMWKTQGGETVLTWENEQVFIKDGTAFMTKVSEKTKYDYEVNGTH